jgi:hypothetical protein
LADIIGVDKPAAGKPAQHPLLEWLQPCPASRQYMRGGGNLG